MHVFHVTYTYTYYIYHSISSHTAATEIANEDKRERGGAAAHTSRRERENSGDKRERVCVCERGEERRTSVNIEREEYSAQYDRLVCVGV